MLEDSPALYLFHPVEVTEEDTTAVISEKFNCFADVPSIISIPPNLSGDNSEL